MSGIARDGSPVELYRRLPAQGEPAIIHASMPDGGSVLDLGCGAGRIAGPLLALGHAVTGIDDEPGMLAALPAGVEGILGDARRIRLGRRFDAVLLASHLVNAPADGPAFAATAAAHLEPDGVLIGEAYPPDWDPASGVGRAGRLGAAAITLVRVHRDGDLVDAAVRYDLGARSWEQAFTARILDRPALASLLAGAGLRLVRWLDRPGWFLGTLA